MLPAFRCNEARSFIARRPPGLLDQPGRAALGRPDPVGSGAGRLRLGRRARQLPERAHATRARARTSCPTFWPDVRHLLGKDILRFHCVYWPALLLAAGYDVPQQLFVHGYLLIDDRKISKSLGNVVDPLDLIDVYGVDAVRFWSARVGPVRTGRQRLARRPPRALRARARQRPRQPPLADDGDDRPLPRRRLRDGSRPTRRSPAIARAARRRRRRPARRLRHHGRARADLGGRPRRSTATSRQTAPWQLAKDEARAAELDRVLYDLADGLRVRRGRARRLPAATRRRGSSRRSGSRVDARLGRGRATAGRPAVEGIEPAAAALPARRRARDGRVTDTHAHLDACDEPPAELARPSARGRA